MIEIDKKDFLAIKDFAAFFWPTSPDALDKESVQFKYLDILESYIWPVRHGLSREDLEDFLEPSHTQQYGNNFEMYLRYKFYVSTIQDISAFFASLFPNVNTVPCFKICLSNLQELSEEEFRTLFELAIQKAETNTNQVFANVDIIKGTFSTKDFLFSEVK